MRSVVCVMLLAIAACAGLSSAPQAAPNEHRITAHDLRCEYLVDPMGVEEAAPRLSWTLKSDRRAERQTAFQILVASTKESIEHEAGDLWDSGKVASSRTSHIEYAGRPLASRQACFWKVRAWDRDDRPGPWSEVARWEMGLLNANDWHAKWIDVKSRPPRISVSRARYQTVDGKVERDVTDIVARMLQGDANKAKASNESLGGDPAYGVRKRLVIDYLCDEAPMQATIAENAPIALPDERLPYLRKSFALDKPIRAARIYATALGVYELRLNGQRVVDQRLAPGWTDYRKRVRYQVHDVTAMLNVGNNAWGAVVAPGWFCGHAGLFNAVKFYGDRPALISQLEVTFEDGSTQWIVTDESWKTHPGPWLQADLLKGETYDAKFEIADWDTADFDDREWVSATTREESRNLQSDICQPVREIMELPAKTLAEPAPGRWTFDLGQNIVGVVRLKVNAPRGTIISIRHGEMLQPDGTIYTQNLRVADSTDRYICNSEGAETWQPLFTFHGFRYVEVTGLVAKPELDDVTGIVIGTDLPIVGTFECSDPRLNQLQSNIVWGLRGNYLSIPTDCPQRDERMGWMADAQVFLPTAMCNADVAAFMTKWMTDVADAQREDGAHSDVAPVMSGLNYGTPAWGDAGVIVPWLMYQHYGDKRILERHIDSMMRWVNWCKANSTNLIRDKARGNDYGDWLSIKADTPKDLLGTAYFAHAADIVARSLEALGRKTEADAHRRLFDDIRSAFVHEYVAPDGRMTGDTQTDYVLALRFGLLDGLPDSARRAALHHLVANIQRHDHHLSTGFVGVSHLLQTLTDDGQSDVAYRLLMQDTFPSWLFPVKHGATTIWERWDGWLPETGPHPDWTMNSFNHYSLGSCGAWMFESVAGIAFDRAGNDPSHIVIKPEFTGPLTWVKARCRSIQGEVTNAWRFDNGRLSLRVSIPPNATATVHFPTPDDGRMLESGRALRESDGISQVRTNGTETLVEIGSGDYSFTMN